MEHRDRDARGRRSLVLAQIAVCIFFFLAFATLPIVPSTEARVPALDATPISVLATPVLATPEATPLPGQTALDKYTVALYRFDNPGSAAFDETWRYPGTSNGNASVTGLGVYRGALSLDGEGSNVTTADLPSLSQGTLEAFIDFQSVCYTAFESFPIITARAADGGREILQLRVYGGLMFGIYSEGQWKWVDSGINACRYLNYGPSAPGWPYETWRFHQVAATWGPRGQEIWVDGVLHGVGNDDPRENIAPYKYKCNPQMQLGALPWPPNPSYPVCQTPVAASQMPAYPPGDYTGGIPSASFMIGCGSDGCFKGRLDEVRISNIQRVFTYAVVPTITPTPTHTPVAIGGQYAPDSSTVALYHLSSTAEMGGTKFVLDEATAHWNAWLDGDAILDPYGRFNYGLYLDGAVHGTGGFPTILGMYPSNLKLSSPGTFEAWLDLSPNSSSDSSPLFAAGDRSDKLLFGFYPPGRLMLGISNGREWFWNTTQIVAKDIAGTWHHVAATWGSRGMEVWLDGSLCNTTSYSGTFPSLSSFTAVGCDREGNCMAGLVDEVRISGLQRTFTASSPQYRAARDSVPLIWSQHSQFLPFVQVAPTPVYAGCRPFSQ